MNLILNTGGGPITMSSREIAELLDARHDSVKRTMERLAESDLISFTPTVETSHEGAGARPVEVYLVGKRDSYVVVARLSPEFTARLVDRWQELESGGATASLSDPNVLRHLLLENVEKVIALQGRVQEMQPAVDALEQIAEAHGSFTRTEAAKNLGIPPHTLMRWLTTNGWTYRRPGSREDIAYQSKIVAGYLEHKIATGPRTDGTEWASTQVRVTPKGLTALAKAFPKSARAA